MIFVYSQYSMSYSKAGLLAVRQKNIHTKIFIHMLPKLPYREVITYIRISSSKCFECLFTNFLRLQFFCMDQCKLSLTLVTFSQQSNDASSNLSSLNLHPTLLWYVKVLEHVLVPSMQTPLVIDQILGCVWLIKLDTNNTGTKTTSTFLHVLICHQALFG